MAFTGARGNIELGVQTVIFNVDVFFLGVRHTF